MSDTVMASFRVQLASTMDTLLKAAVLEITKIFESSMCEYKTNLIPTGELNPCLFENQDHAGCIRRRKDRQKSNGETIRLLQDVNASGLMDCSIVIAPEINVDVPEDWCAPLVCEDINVSCTTAKQENACPSVSLWPLTGSLWRMPAIKQETWSTIYHSEQDQEPIPMMKRIKSRMGNQIHLDSSDLFEPSDDNGEQYISKTKEDYSDGTDISVVIAPVEDIRDQCLSPTELNNGYSKQAVHRGSSPSTPKRSSGMRHERKPLSNVPCPTTQTSSGHSSKQSERDLEHNLSDNATSPLIEDGVADGTLSIPAVCKRENGSRMYNKKQYCLYCKLGVVKIARHLERAHSNKPEVARAVSFPKSSKERRLHLEHLRNRGNFAHNVNVLNSGVGNLVPRKQPKQVSQAQNFLHCVYCQGFFSKKLLWRHMRICKFKPGVQHKPEKTCVQAL